MTKEQRQAYFAEWRKKNPDKVKFHNSTARRKARESALMPVGMRPKPKPAKPAPRSVDLDDVALGSRDLSGAV